MTGDLRPACGGPDLFGQLAATDPYQRRARRLFERGQVAAVNGNEADVRVGVDASGGALELKGVPIASGYVPRVGDWVAIQYEAGHSAAPWVVGPSMAGDASSDPAGIGVFAISDAAPLDPPKSTIYFDDTLDTWRGWDGSQWVDFFAKLHNTLPDLQGGTASEYYHFSQWAHDALARFIGAAGYPNGLGDGYIQRLRFAAIDASHTERTRFFEKDGDFFWAINAEYDAANDRWSRVDTAKYAYLIGLYSKNGIPHEPGDLGGVAWWRATPGSNPIADYTAVGGWELGFMMTQHRNYVMGGMNLELDGSGSPPYGRFTQIGSEDASVVGGLTLMQRNAWYEGSGSWGRDVASKASAAMGFDPNGDLFVWWYPDSAEGNAPWSTSAWQQRALFHLSGSTRGRFDVIRWTSETAAGRSAFLAKHKTSANMGDGFGAGYGFAIEDSAGVENTIAAMYALRAGADNTGKLSWQIASGGALAEQMSLTAAGVLSVSGASMNLAGKALSVEAASAINQDLTTDSTTAQLGRLGIAMAVASPFAALEIGSVGGGYYAYTNVRLRTASSGAGDTTVEFSRQGASFDWRLGIDGWNANRFSLFRVDSPYTRFWAVTEGGQHLFPNGAAAVPVLSHINDLDTGVFLPASDAWSVATGGVEQVRVSGNGTLDLRNAAGSLLVNGTKVVGARRAHIADATTDTTVLRNTVNAILAALEGHGLVASA
jgi:hypothetical protein